VVVRSFPRGRSWVVRVSEVAPPWPVLLSSNESGVVTPIVLDQRETNIHDPMSVWLTVPVFEKVAYSRKVDIELAAGQTIDDSAELLLERARNDFAQRRTALAAQTLDRCINTYPQFPECHKLLGDVFMAVGRRDEARTQYNEFHRLVAAEKK
jgi:hypothetical protein